MHEFDFKRQVRILDSLCTHYEQKKDSVGFYEQIKQIESVVENQKDKELLLLIQCAIFQFRLAVRSIDKENLYPIFNVYKESFEKVGNTRMAALLERRLADYYWIQLQNHELGFEHYLNVYNRIEKLSAEEYPDKQHAVYDVGEKYYFFNDFSNAIKFLQKALLIENKDDPGFRIAIYNTIGLSFQGLNQFDSSNFYFYKGLEFAEKLGNKGWIGNLTGNIGINFLKQGNNEEANQWFRKDVLISLQAGNNVSAAGALMMIADLNFKNGDILTACKQVDSSKYLLSNNSSLQRRKTLYPLLSKVEAYRGNTKLSMIYLDSALWVRDQLDEKANAMKLLRVQQKEDNQRHRLEVQKLENEKSIKTLQRNATLAGMFLSMIGGILLFRQIKKTRKAKRRSDELLLNILPEDIAGELKESGESKARRYDNVTVLFGDFVDFTMLSEKMNPEELVRILDSYFKAFDRIITNSGLEKIKTVGDAYIFACGLPGADNIHAEKVVRAAIQQLKVMKEHPEGWRIRIGIHSGSVVAGIVGVKKFAYDIWGDTVNTAARMESHGTPGKINISKATYELLKDHPDFIFESRGKMEVKGKGEIEMWFVEEKVISQS